MPYASVDAGQIYYDVAGEGPWLVFIHGAWASHEWWRWQIPDLSRNYRTLALDVRGHGRSTPLDGAYSVRGFVRDLDMLFEEVGVEKAVLVGWSMGGLISLQYCMDHPSKVAALILIATRGTRNPKMKRRIRFQYLQARLRLMADLSFPRVLYDEGDQEPEPRQDQAEAGGKQDWVEREVRGMLSPGASREVFDWVTRDIRENPRTNYFEVAKSIWDWDGTDGLGKIGVPTLIMVGALDDRTAPRLSRTLHAMIPGSKLVIVEGAGHCLTLERPDLVNTEILKFLHEASY